jgi:hypothetical protein
VAGFLCHQRGCTEVRRILQLQFPLVEIMLVKTRASVFPKIQTPEFYARFPEF